MKIAIYAKDEGIDIVRITMAYCQRWDCYPAIEHYSEREDLLYAIKNLNINIAILKGSRKDCDAIIVETEKMGMQLNFIWLSNDNFCMVNCQQSPLQSQKESLELAQKIEKGLEACGIPAPKESLCRVHLKAE